MSRWSDFRSIVVSLWFRLITVGIVGLVFSTLLWLASGKAQGWAHYLTGAEVAFEVVVRLVATALAGIVLGTLATTAVAPFLWYFHSKREGIADWVAKAVGVLVVFLLSKNELTVLIAWSYKWSNHRKIFDVLLMAAFYVAFAAVVLIPRARKQVGANLEIFLGEKMTRRTAIATVAGTAALVATEFVLSKRAPIVRAALDPQRPKSNTLLITFDALSAEDMSLYGYRLPTTPNIDAFARKASVFTNFYSATSYTTSCVATIMTGMYPSESRVYQMASRVRGVNTTRILPQLMRAAGYATGGFYSNPYAYYFARSLASNFDVLPEPTFQPGSLQYMWDVTGPLHQDTGIGSRGEEHADLMRIWNQLFGLHSDLWLEYRAAASFEHAQEILAKLPEGFFLWLHVMTPHGPYLPDAPERGRFLPDDQLITDEFEDFQKHHWLPHYAPDQQSEVDKRRLAYDEFLVTADRNFGTFMSELENNGKLQNTTVILSADHGESFEGGYYQHGGPYLTRPVIHIPLIIKTPNQQEARTVRFTADQTSLAPTILELAGVPKPDWMHGESLVGWLGRDGQGEGQGLAFAQYLERNSVFKPPHRGTMGVIQGQYQYVYYIDTKKSALRPLKEAQIWNLDRSAEFPAHAAALHAELHARFPELVDKEN